jgi:murein tripeptide amidase MpaA
MTLRFVRSVLISALILSGALCLGQGSWARYRIYVPDPVSAQRLADSSLSLFSESISLGETDVVVGPDEMHKLWTLRLRYELVGMLPDPDAWMGQGAGGADNYRSQYFNMDGLLSFYEALRAAYPTYVSRRAIGISHNGETIWAYLFFNPMSRTGSRTPPNNFIFATGTHAREWIAPSVGMHIGVKMIETFTQGGALNNHLLGRVGVWVIPSLNPDGYRHSWNVYRYWRKNRRNNGGGVYGVDLNRNYSVGWGGTGSSGNPSSDTYRGPSAFSEPEMQGLKAFSESLPGVRGFIDFHSYGQDILWSWSYTTALAPGEPWLRQAGTAMRDAMVANGGLSYTIGPGGATLYVAGGTSKDWYYSVFNVPAFTIELRDTGQFGFVLPEAQIAPTQDEAWWAVVGLLLNTSI